MTYESTQQAGKRTGLSGQYVRRLAQSGRIAGAVKVGKTWLIPQDWQRPSLRAGNPNFKQNAGASPAQNQQRRIEMNGPTNEELATDRELWMTYIDPNNEDPHAFDTMTTEEKIAMIRDLWPERDQE